MFNEIIEKVLGIGAIVLPIYSIIFTILLIISIVFIIKEFIKEKNIKTTGKNIAILVVWFIISRIINSIPYIDIISYYIKNLVNVIIGLTILIYLIKLINKKKESNKKIGKIVLKIIVLIPVILLILLSIVQVQRNINTFKIDTEFKYKVNYVSTMPITTFAPLSSNQDSYYEIDLEKKIVELRKDSIPTVYGVRNGNVDYYYRKLEYRKILTDEECNQLRAIFYKAINGIDIDISYSQEQDLNKGFLGIDTGYYKIESKYKKNVKMCDEDESLFYNIVKK